MNFTMELILVEETFEDSLKQHGFRQKDAANLYAMALVSHWTTDWARVNGAILAKWPKGLQRIKRMAWVLVSKDSHLANNVTL